MWYNAVWVKAKQKPVVTPQITQCGQGSFLSQCFHKILGLFSRPASFCFATLLGLPHLWVRCKGLRKACVVGSERHLQSSLHHMWAQMPPVQQAVSTTGRGGTRCLLSCTQIQLNHWAQEKTALPQWDMGSSDSFKELELIGTYCRIHKHQSDHSPWGMLCPRAPRAAL